MKQIFLLFLIPISILSSCNKVKNDLTEEGMKVNAKSIVEIECKAVDKFGEIQEEDCRQEYKYLYDVKGNIKYFEALDLKTTQTIVYDKSGKLKEIKSRTDNFSPEKVIFNYDRQGNSEVA
jgi:hypothetical protein